MTLQLLLNNVWVLSFQLYGFVSLNPLFVADMCALLVEPLFKDSKWIFYYI
jgi:hypothetical protein